MEIRKDYCPMVDKCPHEPIDITPNSYFLIQPFDEEKEKREKAIIDALTKFYGSKKKYELKKSDSKIYNRSIYCDICKKIKSSQFSIVDISGESYEIVDKESGKSKTQIFLRPNVALELGMTYGLNKPALILSRKVNGKRQIPSDIEFVRYIDISLIDFKGWSGASQKLLDRLRESIPFRPIKESLEMNNIIFKKKIKKDYKLLLHLKEKWSSLQYKSYSINQIIYNGNRIVGIIRDAEDLIEGIRFNFYILENEIEQLIGQLEVYHIQPSGLAQVEFYIVEGGGDYLNNVAKYCLKKDTFVPGEHRLELIVHEKIEKINLKELRELRDFINLLNIV